MSEKQVVNATSRESYGSGNSRRLRREGKVPGVIYGGDKDPQALVLDHDELFHQLENEAFASSILDVNVDKKKEQAILREVQVHPYKPQIIHIDFLRIRAGQAITLNIPLHLVGAEDAPGVDEGGIMSQMAQEIEVICLPKDLPEYLELDVSKLEMGDSLHLSDIPLPEGVKITALEYEEGEDYTVASVLAPRAEEPEEDLEAEEGEEGEEASDEDGEGDDASESDGDDSEK